MKTSLLITLLCLSWFLMGSAFPNKVLTDWPPYSEQKALVKAIKEKNKTALSDYVGVAIRLHSQILSYDKDAHAVKVLITHGPLQNRTAVVKLDDNWFMREIAPQSIGRKVWCDAVFSETIVDGKLEFTDGRFN